MAGYLLYIEACTHSASVFILMSDTLLYSAINLRQKEIQTERSSLRDLKSRKRGNTEVGNLGRIQLLPQLHSSQGLKVALTTSSPRECSPRMLSGSGASGPPAAQGNTGNLQATCLSLLFTAIPHFMDSHSFLSSQHRLISWTLYCTSARDIPEKQEMYQLPTL